MSLKSIQKNRYLSAILSQFVQEKMVLLSGPRQVGKTSLCQTWLSSKKGTYLTWDSEADRTEILSKEFPGAAKHVVLDEIHKYLRWKRWLKGMYDKHKDKVELVVTGSARLETFQKGSDSMFGRYELLRLHPFSVAELSRNDLSYKEPIAPPKDWLAVPKASPVFQKNWEQLFERSGFPEPYSKNNSLQYNRWNLRRRELVLKQDVRDLTEIKHITELERLSLLLPDRVGAPLSVNNLRESVSIAYDTAVLWLEWLERLYYCYRLKPFTGSTSRSLKKEQKLYLWNWREVENPGMRFENMVASHLLKAVHYWTDIGFGDYDLLYWRDQQKHEVDFVITLNKKPICLIEAKLGDTTLSPHLRFLQQKLKNDQTDVSIIQLVHSPNCLIRKERALICSASHYLAGLI